MNQILYIENKNKRKQKTRSTGPADIKSIVRFFAIVICIFGVILIGEGSYAIYKDTSNRRTDNVPNILISRVNDTAIVTVESQVEIEKFIYSWNNGEETIIPEGTTSVREEILLPNENSTLYITIEDIKGKEVKYEKEFILDGVDITKPSLEVNKQEGQVVSITAIDETEIAYITYKINDSEEVKIEATQIEQKEIIYDLKLERGENKLIVTAEDTNGNIETKEQTVIVSYEPTVEMVQEGEKLIVIVKDVDGLKSIEVNLNGVIYAGKDLNLKEVKMPFTLVEGTNIIKVKVINVNSLEKEEVKELNYTR